MDEQRVKQESSDGACCGPSCCVDEEAASPKDDLREVQAVVREKYGQAVTAVMKGAKASCCGSAAQESPLGMADRSHHARPLRQRRDRRPARRGAPRFLRLRQPDGARGAAPRRDRPRPRLGRGHRRAPLREARRSHREGLRARHDRRDAGPGQEEQGEGGRHERRVLARDHRGHPAARQHVPTSSSRTASSTSRATRTGPPRGLPRAQAGRPPRRVRHRGPPPAARGRAQVDGAVDGLRRRRAARDRVRRQAAGRWASPTSRSSPRGSTRRRTRRRWRRPHAAATTDGGARHPRRRGDERVRPRSQAMNVPAMGEIAS